MLIHVGAPHDLATPQPAGPFALVAIVGLMLLKVTGPHQELAPQPALDIPESHPNVSSQGKRRAYQCNGQNVPVGAGCVAVLLDVLKSNLDITLVRARHRPTAALFILMLVTATNLHPVSTIRATSVNTCACELHTTPSFALTHPSHSHLQGTMRRRHRRFS